MNIKEFKRRAIRHGEVILVPVDKLPEDLEVAEKGTRVTVGFSESHHHHVAVADSDCLTLLRPVGADSSDLYLEVSGAARIEHLKPYDRHETKPIQPGYYFIGGKQQYDYFLKRTARVLD